MDTMDTANPEGIEMDKPATKIKVDMLLVLHTEFDVPVSMAGFEEYEKVMDALIDLVTAVEEPFAAALRVEVGEQFPLYMGNSDLVATWVESDEEDGNE